MLKKIFFVIACLVVSAVKGQDYKLGRVSIEELQEKQNPIDTSAAAGIIFRRGKTYFTANEYWNVVYEVECRIKIYKKEGYEHANQSLTYWTGGKSIKAYFSDAVTYNLVNGEIEKTKLKNDGEFKEKVNDEYERKYITMPNVKEGSIIEFRYTKIIPYFNPISDWYFQYDIPAKYIEYEIGIPNYFEYNTYLSGYTKIESDEQYTRYGRGGNFQEFVKKYWAENVKPFKDESFVNNIENYISVLKYELAATKFNSGKEKYATDWPAVTKKIYDDDSFGRQLGFTKYFEDDINALLAGQPSTEENKIKTIFKYVQTHMKWDGESQYWCEKGVKRAYEDRTGNAAEINLMLVAMLKHAGISAYPVLVSTRANGVALYPTRTAYNYVVAGIKKGEDVILLDATSKYTEPDILPLRALNWVGRLIRETGTSLEVNLMPKKKSREVINISATITEGGEVNGLVRDQYLEHNAYVFRERHSGVNKESHTKRLEEKYNGIVIENYDLQNDTETDKPVIEQYNFSHNAIVDIIGDNIYISPLLFFTQKENPFKQEEREYPVDFPFPYQDRFLVSLTIPDGYTVASLPEPLSLAMEQNIGSFKYNTVVNNNIIQVSIVSDINYSNINTPFYNTLKSYFQQMIEKQNEKIVLKKS